MLHFTCNFMIGLQLLDAQNLHGVLQLFHLLRRSLIHFLDELVAFLDALPGSILLLLDYNLLQLMLQGFAALLFKHLFHSLCGLAFRPQEIFERLRSFLLKVSLESFLSLCDFIKYILPLLLVETQDLVQVAPQGCIILRSLTITIFQTQLPKLLLNLNHLCELVRADFKAQVAVLVVSKAIDLTNDLLFDAYW